MSTETPTGAGRSASPVRRQNRTANAASPWRITTGVVSLAFSAWGIVYAAGRLFTRNLGGPSTPFVGWMNFLIIVGAVGCLVTGIVIIVKQRKRGGATPWLVGSFAAAVLVAALGLGTLDYSGTPGGESISTVGAVATIALSALVIVMEKKRR